MCCEKRKEFGRLSNFYVPQKKWCVHSDLYWADHFKKEANSGAGMNMSTTLRSVEDRAIECWGGGETICPSISLLPMLIGYSYLGFQIGNSICHTWACHKLNLTLVSSPLHVPAICSVVHKS